MTASETNSTEPRCFGIVPAAGRSRRMGQPKLLLPWQGATLIEHVLQQWRASQVATVVMVVHRDDVRLIEVAQQTGTVVIVPDVPPVDMKASVRHALQYFIAHHSPTSADAFLLAPADLPRLASSSIDLLVQAHRAEPGQLRVAAHNGKRGHPALFPWPLADDVFVLADHEGLSTLVDRHVVALVEGGDQVIADDLDTPEDYERLYNRYGR